MSRFSVTPTTDRMTEHLKQQFAERMEQGSEINNLKEIHRLLVFNAWLIRNDAELLETVSGWLEAHKDILKGMIVDLDDDNECG